MKPAIALKEKLKGPHPVTGVLITYHLWPGLIELAMNAGMDYAIIDAEHFNHGSERIAEACALGRLAGFPVLIRPPTSDYDQVRLAMDLGPSGLLLPMVESSEQLDRVRDGLYMPPRGQRRPGGPSNLWINKYDYPTFRAEIEDHLIVIPQIESPQGVENAAALAAHEVTTALGVGPFDLSARLGVCYDPNHPRLREALARIRTAAQEAGKPPWMIGEATALLSEGYRFICIAETTNLLKSALAREAQRARQWSAANQA